MNYKEVFTDGKKCLLQMRKLRHSKIKSRQFLISGRVRTE